MHDEERPQKQEEPLAEPGLEDSGYLIRSAIGWSGEHADLAYAKGL
jgi:hypothetical protein